MHDCSSPLLLHDKAKQITIYPQPPKAAHLMASIVIDDKKGLPQGMGIP